LSPRQRAVETRLTRHFSSEAGRTAPSLRLGRVATSTSSSAFMDSAGESMPESFFCVSGLSTFAWILHPDFCLVRRVPDSRTTEYATEIVRIQFCRVTGTGTLACAPGTPISSYAYTLGSAGNRLSVAELSGRTVNYGYDDLYRLTSENTSRTRKRLAAISAELQRGAGSVLGLVAQRSIWGRPLRAKSTSS
jgi:hypothetical protein